MISDTSAIIYTSQLSFVELRSILIQLNDLEYAMPLTLLHDSTIGQHVRHILDYYQCFFDSSAIGYVDYAGRKRNVLLESHVQEAVSTIEHFSSNIIDYDLYAQPIEVVIQLHDQVIRVQSSLERELVYLMEHSIHHFAMIAVAIKHYWPHIELPAQFGLAYSTRQHTNASASC